MEIDILYFASLRERVGRGNDKLSIPNVESLTVDQVWQQATAQDNIPDDILIAINQEYSNTDAVVSDGDEVAFFPPVTGG